MKIGSLFAGIGGLELGLEWAGVGRAIWQVEKDPYAQSILAKHWPDATRFDDVRAVGGHPPWRHVLPAVDVLCGGFPCQDVSVAGKGAGLDGARSGLWSEFARIIGEIRPRFVVVENVAALVSNGLDRVLCDLAARGYDAIWLPVRASDVGAPHRRERLFIIAWVGDAASPRLPRSKDPRSDCGAASEGGGCLQSERAGQGLADADEDEAAIVRARLRMAPLPPPEQRTANADDAIAEFRQRLTPRAAYRELANRRPR